MFRRKIFSSSKNRRPPAPETSPEAAVASHAGRSSSVGSDLTLVEEQAQNNTARRSNSEIVVRSESLPENIRSISQTSTKSKGSGDRTADPLGLTLLHAPDGPQSADIIFIHGLGGSSRLTWAKDHDLERFWPFKWLPDDPDVQNCRIFTFGYNAHFRASSQSPNLGISDFAKNLLYDMVYGRDASGQVLGIGEAPILIVAHSMGGLVFKKAFLDAQLDNRYLNVASSIKAVIFLATPHRGGDLSALLNKLLSASFRGSKQYVTELDNHGSFLRTLNEQFRHIAENLQIFSFYETIQTSLGLGSSMIVEEDAAKLGYPDEVSRSLNADHHGACKFDSPTDINYRTVLGAIKNIVCSFGSSSDDTVELDMEKIKVLLSIPDSLDLDLSLFLSRRAEGTCSGILEESKIQFWIRQPQESHVLWLHSRPARGKSVFSSFLIDQLREEGASVQHFFFRSGDETKRSVGSLLRFLAFQIAKAHPTYRRALADISSAASNMKDTDWRSIWKRLFTNILFKLKLQAPLYWIFDGLDESAMPHQILELMAETNASVTPIRVLLTSRWSASLFTSFGRINSKIQSSWFSLDKNSTDMRIFVEEELRYLSWDESVKDEVTRTILAQSNDNFLWVHLILEEIKDCHTEDDVRYALNELPPGMESLYQRMEESISNIRRPSDRSLSRQLLTWAVYARRPLLLDEVSDILEPEFGHILDLTTTVTRLCGHFLVIEGEDRIGLLHQTAREYLMSSTTLPFKFTATECHDELFRSSLGALMERNVKSKIQSGELHPLQYRGTTWMHHLRNGSSSESDQHLDLLIKFFTQPCALVWVQMLAIFGQLKALLDTAHTLDTFVKKKRRSDAAREPAKRRYEDLELLELWSRDLLKLPGKYGAILSKNPASVHSSVAQFCPSKTAIHRVFGPISSTPKVQGLPDDWDDCLARVSVGSGHQATLLCCSAKHLAVADSSGALSIWDCTTFHRVQLVNAGEMISALCFSERGDRVATYGHSTTKVWSIQTGKLVNSFDNPPDMMALTIDFVDEDSKLLVGSDRRCLLQGSLHKETGSWDIANIIMLEESESLEGTILGSPTALAVSPDRTKVAVAYRRFPMTVWSLEPSKILKRVHRDQKASTAASPFVTSLAWHPNNEELMGIFMDGSIFKFHVNEDTYYEQPPDAGQFPLHIRISPDGTTFAVCGVHGTIKIHDYQSNTLIYQLTSEEHVTNLCFSQDGRRFYDIRGSSCNIWEPNALIRLAATDDHPASSQSPEESIEQSNLASEFFADNPIPIIITSPMPYKSVTCLGDDEGLVMLYDYDSGQKLKIDRTATGMSIEHLAWSRDGCHFAYAEVSGRVTVVAADSTSTGWTHRRITRFKPKPSKGGLKKILLSLDSERLLVVFRDTAQVWRISDSVKIGEYNEPGQNQNASWVILPASSGHVLRFSQGNLFLHSWQDLSVLTCWTIPSAEVMRTSAQKLLKPGKIPNNDLSHNDDTHDTIENAFLTFYKDNMFVEISQTDAKRKRRSQFMLISEIRVDNSDKVHDIACSLVPAEVAEEIERPLNVLKNGYLVYIDQSFGVCTWPVKSMRGIVDAKCHFYIPRDWISDQSLPLLSITESGAIVCPRKGEITVISTTLASDW
ncbi:hypothetical protein G7054_g6367 [Neopestalotiopsis clavispora]|nr:hypothetical protein G7054_g6367 [Neopestalotiopsis clavispora]